MTYSLLINTDGGSYQYGFHLGTIRPVAKECAVDIFNRKAVPHKGTKIQSVSLFWDGRLTDKYDGKKWLFV